MQEVNKIDVRSGSGVFRHYEKLGLSTWYLLAEYVDNAIGSYQQNKQKLQRLDKNYRLKVSFFRDPDTRTIRIKDNAAGIADSELNRAFVIGERPQDRSGANEFGVGMKLASFHFTHKWSVRTKALGEPMEKTIILDVDDIEARDDTIIDVIRQPMSKNEHFTEIFLEEFYPDNWPQYKSIVKIKTFLASIFRRYIDNGDIEISFQDGLYEEILTPVFPNVLEMAFVNDPDYPGGKQKVWKQKVDFSQNIISKSGFSIKKSISGWVGLLALGQTKKKNAGLELVRRNRVIEGDLNAWFPEKIYGSGHSEAGTRLFGELIFSGFGANNNKSKIDWGSEDLNTKEKFLEYLHDLIIEDKSKNSQRDFWVQLLNYIAADKQQKNTLDLHIQKANKKIEAKLAFDFKNYAPADIEDLEKTSAEAEFEKENVLPDKLEFLVPVGEDKYWNVIISPNDGSGDGVWFKTTAVTTSMWPREITIEWDINHPYSLKTFRTGEDIEAYEMIAPEIFKLIAYLVIGQESIKASGKQTIGVDYFTDLINYYLGNA